VNATTKAITRRVEPHQGELAERRRFYRPAIDIIETPEDFRLIADMPGMTADDLEIELDRGQLSIIGRVKPRQDEQTRWLMQEYGVGDFRRVLSTGQGLDTENIIAKLKDGVLTIRLPKSERLKPRQIKVRG
jgi:HSP20 family protein